MFRNVAKLILYFIIFMSLIEISTLISKINNIIIYNILQMYYNYCYVIKYVI